MTNHYGIEMSIEAARNVEATGVSPMHDIADVRAGRETRASLLAMCLDGTEAGDPVQIGWVEYVDAIMAAV